MSEGDGNKLILAAESPVLAFKREALQQHFGHNGGKCIERAGKQRLVYAANDVTFDRRVL